MPRRPRRNHTPVFKSKVALAAIKGDKTVAELALAAQASGKTLGVVIDKVINGPGGRCDLTGSMDIKD